MDRRMAVGCGLQNLVGDPGGWLTHDKTLAAIADLSE
jgi:hypothetical protein